MMELEEARHGEHSGLCGSCGNTGAKRNGLYCRPCKREYGIRWRQRHAGRLRDEGRSKAQAVAGSLAQRARNAVKVAVRAGRLVAPETCEECGEAWRLAAHHDDYGFPLVVRWVCYRCHSLIHRRQASI